MLTFPQNYSLSLRKQYLNYFRNSEETSFYICPIPHFLIKEYNNIDNVSKLSETVAIFAMFFRNINI